MQVVNLTNLEKLYDLAKGIRKFDLKPKKAVREDTAAATLVEAVRRADPSKVRALNLVCCRVPLVSTTKDAKYGAGQVEVGNGLYVITHSSNQMKKEFLVRISKALNLAWKIEWIK